MKYAICLVAAIAVCCMAGCSMSSFAKDYSGLSIPEGTPKAHVNTTNVAVHLLFSQPIWGDATLGAVVKDCTAAAKSEGASHIRLVQSNVTALWWLLPPITFVVQPVIANTAGDAY